MTEKEKAITGQLYNPNDKTLKEERNRCKEICHEYNRIKPLNMDERKRLIKSLFGKTTDNFLIEQPFYCDYGYNIEIGDNFYASHNGVILDCAKIIFGDNVLIGPNCGFYTAEHPLDVKLRNEGLEFARPIRIGNNVWFGGNCIVLSGVTIGDNAVIGAGSVVTRDILPNVVAVGNPCRVIKELPAE